MTKHEINPFQELYVTDDADPQTFVDLFSDRPVRHVQAIFKRGNVVLKGSQGSGKSMLLNLLKPQIRQAYHRAEREFPVPVELRRFIGAGINITRSGILDITGCRITEDPSENEELYPFYFADFLNYWVVSDILATLHTMRSSSAAFEHLVDGNCFDDFAHKLAKQDCWFGYLDGCSRFGPLRNRVDERIQCYRKLNQRNEMLPIEIQETKTGIGEPLARTENCLKTSHVISNEVPVIVRIDQVERLEEAADIKPGIGRAFRRIVNKAVGARDSRISYRIGTRRYAWENDLTIYGTTSRLERNRDFQMIDLREMVRRKEDTKTYFFPEFACEAFVKRLTRAGLQTNDGKGNPLIQVFGHSPDPEEEAKRYLGYNGRNGNDTDDAKTIRILRLDDSWPEEWRAFLISLFRDNPFSAMLAAAWARQRGQKGRAGDRLKSPPPRDEEPWNTRPYWRKERKRQCLLQIAARYAQRLKWSGHASILALSGGNITIFLSICQEIWDAYLRSERTKSRKENTDPILQGIPPDIQAVAIDSASSYWYDKIPEQPLGDDRQRFVDELGRQFREWLRDDISMSYPGRNGFSLTHEDLAASPELARFLRDAADYGDLYDAPHTTKKSDGLQRTKYYLSPILSPRFQLPESHTKEPYYGSVEETVKWLIRSKIYVKGLTELHEIQEHPVTSHNRRNGGRKSDVQSADTQQVLPLRENDDK